MSYGELQRDRERFADARRAFTRARTDFDATRAQREVSLDAEADLLLRMADAALRDGANRRASVTPRKFCSSMTTHRARPSTGSIASRRPR